MEQWQRSRRMLKASGTYWDLKCATTSEAECHMTCFSLAEEDPRASSIMQSQFYRNRKATQTSEVEDSATHNGFATQAELHHSMTAS